MWIKEELAAVKEMIWQRAQEVFAQKRETHQGMGDFIDQFLRELEQSLQGGKAIRGSLVCYGAISCGGKIKPAIIDLALAVEMFHTYLLIHDDIIDRDDIRRGQMSFHKKYSEWPSLGYSPSDARHFGTSMAIMAGDILSSMAYELITQADLPTEVRLAILQQVNKMLFKTTVGEILDVLNDLREEASFAHLMKVHTIKTGYYTFHSPLTIGALAAGSNRRQLTMLQDYSLPIGVAFQLHDDLLGMFGEQEKIGKPLHSDLREGKQTLLIIEAYKRGNEEQRRLVDAALGNLNVSVEQAEAVKQIVRETGSYDYSRRLAHILKNQAIGFLDVAHISERGHRFLCEMAEYIVAREY